MLDGNKNGQYLLRDLSSCVEITGYSLRCQLECSSSDTVCHQESAAFPDPAGLWISGSSGL
jgi:hypothetical protein